MSAPGRGGAGTAQGGAPGAQRGSGGSVPTRRPGGSGGRGLRGLTVYLLAGLYFGIVITKGEVISWFRIQEMFRFQGFHMYGVLMTAVVVAAISLRVLRRLEARTVEGEAIHVPPKTLGRGVRYVAGGSLFGVGWAFTGACPGPLLALVGGGVTVMLVAVAAAALGTWTYGALRPRLPH